MLFSHAQVTALEFTISGMGDLWRIWCSKREVVELELELELEMGLELELVVELEIRTRTRTRNREGEGRIGDGSVG